MGSIFFSQGKVAPRITFFLHEKNLNSYIQTLKAMRQFFIPPHSLCEGICKLEGSEAHHLKNVLRISPGEYISLFDGNGRRCRARVEEIHKNHVLLSPGNIQTYSKKGPRFYLGQSILKGKKMDLVIQKAVELGVSGIIPLTTSYCDIKNPAPGREQRWEKIMMEASKQCGRTFFPELSPTSAFTEFLECYSEKYDIKIVLYEQENSFEIDSILKDITSKSISALVVIGPEGGFSDTEIECARDRGFHSATLGPLTLRAETASIVGMGIMQFLLRKL